MFDVKAIADLLQGQSPAEKAKICAYILAPGFVLGFTVSSILGGSFGLNVSYPVTVAKLNAEISETGAIMRKEGFALIIEPNSSEFRIPTNGKPTGMWSSLDQSVSRANMGRFVIDHGGINVKPPFIGVGEPVTVVVQAMAGNVIEVPGGLRKLDEIGLRSRQSESIVSSVLLACVFAFGMSSAQSLRSTDRQKGAAGKVRT